MEAGGREHASESPRHNVDATWQQLCQRRDGRSIGGCAADASGLLSERKAPSTSPFHVRRAYHSRILELFFRPAMNLNSFGPQATQKRRHVRLVFDCSSHLVWTFSESSCKDDKTCSKVDRPTNSTSSPHQLAFSSQFFPSSS